MIYGWIAAGLVVLAVYEFKRQEPGMGFTMVALAVVNSIIFAHWLIWGNGNHREPTQDEIARVAKQKWQQAGCPEGRDIEFWLAAEKELKRIDRTVQ